MKPLVPIDPSVRLNEDDRATHAEEEHRAAALLKQSQRAACRRASEPGVCTNCGSACLPMAVYCDADCRSDHEARIRRGSV
jgi:hypothetical protein